MNRKELSGRAAAAAFFVAASLGVPATGQESKPSQPRTSPGRYTPPPPRVPTGATVKLAAPKAKGAVSLDEALWGRRTLRAATRGPITLEAAGHLAWAGQGVTGEWARRAAPSAGGAYPIDVLLVAGDVAGLPVGVYRYYGVQNVLERIGDGDKRTEFAQMSKFQGIERAPLLIVITGVEERTAKVFTNQALAHTQVAIEAGAVAQNIALEAVALGLGTAVVGDVDEAKLSQILHLHQGEKPFEVIVVSRQ